ncbi:MAG: hypothetical protein ACI9AR_000290 [Flavobacteriaceae bacterium]|jgi:hypothetical protein
MEKYEDNKMKKTISEKDLQQYFDIVNERYIQNNIT